MPRQLADRIRAGRQAKLDELARGDGGVQRIEAGRQPRAQQLGAVADLRMSGPLRDGVLAHDTPHSSLMRGISPLAFVPTDERALVSFISGRSFSTPRKAVARSWPPLVSLR